MESQTQEKSNNDVEAGNGVFAKYKAETKKAITVICLFLVISLMWVKAFVRKSPDSAEATGSIKASSSQKLSSEQAKQAAVPRIRYVELPKVEGRNDVLTRDFFSFDSGGFRESSDRKVYSVSKNNGDEALMRGISEKLTLEAIVTGEQPQAFINDKLLGVGDKLNINEGSNVYVCEIAEIEEAEVIIKCREGTITLKILQSLEVLE